jgi:hypothetical protein
MDGAGTGGRAVSAAPAAGRSEVVSVGYLTAFGAPASAVTVKFVELSLARRLGRALAVLLLCWALALASVPIILAHLILVPGFVVTGLALAYLRFRTARVVQGIHGKCPRCGVEQHFPPAGWGRTVLCPRCKNELTLAERAGPESPAAAPGPA